MKRRDLEAIDETLQELRTLSEIDWGALVKAAPGAIGKVAGTTVGGLAKAAGATVGAVRGAATGIKQATAAGYKGGKAATQQAISGQAGDEPDAELLNDPGVVQAITAAKAAKAKQAAAPKVDLAALAKQLKVLSKDQLLLLQQLMPAMNESREQRIVRLLEMSR